MTYPYFRINWFYPKFGIMQDMKINLSADLGRVIRDTRKAYNWTQSDLAGKVGLFQKDISRIENDTAKVQLQKILVVCAALTIQIDASLSNKSLEQSQTVDF